MRNTTVIIDFSVAAHQLHSAYIAAGLESCVAGSNVENPKKALESLYKSFIQAQMGHMMSLDWLGKLKPEKSNILLAADVKPYWRAEYLVRPEVVARIPQKLKADQKRRDRLVELLEKYQGYDLDAVTPEAIQDQTEILELTDKLKVCYKGGRKFPEYSFTKLKKDMYRLAADQGWNVLSKPGYEADDHAASVVMLNRSLPEAQQNNILLITVDADWMGLVDDRTTWFCMHGWKPRVRALGSAETSEWVKRRLKVRNPDAVARDPKQIWEVKTEQGDKSDNLPKGSPLEVISLVEPPEKYRLWNDLDYSAEVLGHLLGASQPALDGNPARAFLKELGASTFISNYEG